MSEPLTLQAVQDAMQTLSENDVDVKDWDGIIYCYEWEVAGLLKNGVNPRFITIIPSEIPSA
jgi:hypothetical protein